MAAFEDLYHLDKNGNLRNQAEVDRAKENGDLVEYNGKLYNRDGEVFDQHGEKY